MINNNINDQIELIFYKKSSTDFQLFFNSVMKKLHGEEFLAIAGMSGDGGNDGFLWKQGIYYQVFAPYNPDSKKTYNELIVKYKEDFYKLIDNWHKLKPIKEYIFVFNDKGYGIKDEISGMILDLEKINQNIKFSIWTSHEVKGIIIRMTKNEQISIGIDHNKDSVNNFIDDMNKRVRNIIDSGYSGSILKSDLGEDIKYMQEKYITASDFIKYNIDVSYGMYLKSTNKYKECTNYFLDLEKEYPQKDLLIQTYSQLVFIYQNLGENKKAKDYSTKITNIDEKSIYSVISKLYIGIMDNKAVFISPDMLEIIIESSSKRLKSIAYKFIAVIFYMEEDIEGFYKYIKLSKKNNSESIIHHFTEVDVQMNIDSSNGSDFSDSENLVSVLKEKIKTMNYNLNIMIQYFGIMIKYYNLTAKQDNLRNYSDEFLVLIEENIHRLYFTKSLENILHEAHLHGVWYTKSFLYSLKKILKTNNNILDSFCEMIFITLIVHKENLLEVEMYFQEIKQNEFCNYIGSLLNKDFTQIIGKYSKYKDSLKILIYNGLLSSVYSNFINEIVFSSIFNEQEKKILSIFISLKDDNLDEMIKKVRNMKSNDFNDLNELGLLKILEYLESKNSFSSIIDLNLKYYNGNLNYGISSIVIIQFKSLIKTGLIDEAFLLGVEIVNSIGKKYSDSEISFYKVFYSTIELSGISIQTEIAIKKNICRVNVLYNNTYRCHTYHMNNA